MLTSQIPEFSGTPPPVGFVIMTVEVSAGVFRLRRVPIVDLLTGVGSLLGYVPEDKANKSTSGALGASDVAYPSQKAVKTYVDAAFAGLASTAYVDAAVAGKQNALGFTPENSANKTTDATFAASSDTKYPSQKAVKIYVDSAVAGGIGYTPENVANKDVDGTFAANSDTKYPSQKAVKTYTDTGLAGKQASLGYTPQVASAHSTLAQAAPTVLDFSGNDHRSVTLSGDITFSTSNRAAPRTLVIRIVGDGSIRAFTFPAWVFIGAAAPASIAANKVAILSLTCFGANDTDIIAAYAVQP